MHYGIQDESDMYSLSDPDTSPSENVIILVYQILSIKLKSLVLKDANFSVFGCNVSGTFSASFWELSTIQYSNKFSYQKRQVLLDNYDIIMCKCHRRRSDPHVCTTQDPEKELPVL